MRYLKYAAVLWVCLLAAVSLEAVAGGAGAVRKQIESSMLVKGTLSILADGSVESVQLHQPEKLPAGVVRFLGDTAMAWRFEPVVVDGKAAAVSAPMTVRIVANKREDGGYQVTLRSASFDHYDPADLAAIAADKMDPPAYPEKLWRLGAAGTVYVIAKVGRDGKVVDVHAEQVNLRIVTREGEMSRFRQAFVNSALPAARRWTFRIPTQGVQADKPYWVVRVPVDYSLHEGGRAKSKDELYGSWVAYVPGPRNRAQWDVQAEGAGFSPDALEEGVYMAGASKGPKLLTPLVQG